MSEIIFAAEKIQDDDPALKEHMERVDGYAKIPEAYRDKVMKQAKFGVAVEQWVEANQVDAVALQCWDSLELNYGCAPCVTMSMLSDKNIPAACETDIAGAVSMLALTLASQEPLRWPTGTITSPKIATSAYAPTAATSPRSLWATTTSSSDRSACWDVHSER